MDHSLLLFALASCVVVLLINYVFTTSSKIRGLPLPPGPRTSWLGGVDLPKSYQWLTYASWKETYGDLVYMYTFGNPIMIVNSAEAANELLEKRSGIYSSRPVRTMIVELMGWDWLFSAMPYGLGWRRHRTLFHKYFHISQSPVYHPGQVKETNTMLRNLLTSPEKFEHHIRRTSSAIAVNIAYGHKVADEGDSYVTLADTAIQGITKAGVYGSFMVDYIPFLKHVPAWMPGAGFQRKAQEWRRLSSDMRNLPFDVVKRNSLNGSAVPCVASWELDKWMQSDRNAEDEDLIKNITAIIYTAGSDTTVSAITGLFLAMVLNPDVQAKAQEEIDRVIGGNRLPNFDDKDSLPYISCIAWECLRWNPVTPLGLAHFVDVDDEYNGFRIPKGTTVIPNIWAILHDENKYPDPSNFSPERFENPEKNALTGINEYPRVAFGFGRRVCPGRWLAYDSVWIAAASMLAAYNIIPATDENGITIRPKEEVTTGLLSRPKPFKCAIVPRSEAAIALIKQTADE